MWATHFILINQQIWFQILSLYYLIEISKIFELIKFKLIIQSYNKNLKIIKWIATMINKTLPKEMARLLI